MSAQQQAQSFIDEGIDRFQSMFRTVEDEIQKIQNQIQDGRDRVEHETQARVKRIQRDLRKSPIVKRAESIRADATKQIEGLEKRVGQQIDSGVDQFLGALRIASRQDVAKLDKKLGQVSRALKRLEKAQLNGEVVSATKRASKAKKAN
jgi:uncharacterized protein YukE